jgi:hypothetical protein
MPQPTGAIELLSRDDDNVVVLWRKSVLVQSRRGPLTSAALRHVGQSIRAIAGTERPIGVFLVVEPSAPVPGDEARIAQRKLIDDMLAHENLRLAAVILGEDIASTMNRSAGRLVAMGKAHMKRFSDVDEAIAWLVPEMAALNLNIRASELLAVLEHCRKIEPETP